MIKFLKTPVLMVIFVLVAGLLAACGDPTATTAPAATTSGGTAATTAASGTSSGNFFMVSGASSTSVPSMLQAALTQYESQYPGVKAQAFKTSEAAAKVKTSLADAFQKEGWQNLTAGSPDTPQGFVLSFTKGNKGAAVVAFSGAMAGLSQNELIYIVYIAQ
jgi:ABC-type phosphate transport system substrate-binding protein